MVEALAGFRAATARIDNRAVFEIPELLADLLVPRQCTPGPRPFPASPPAAGTDRPPKRPAVGTRR
jgi:hypothetical protein